MRKNGKLKIDIPLWLSVAYLNLWGYVAIKILRFINRKFYFTYSRGKNRAVKPIFGWFFSACRRKRRLPRRYAPRNDGGDSECKIQNVELISFEHSRDSTGRSRFEQTEQRRVVA